MGPVSQLGYFADRTGKETNRFPVTILAGAVALLLFSAGAVMFGQMTGMGVVKAYSGTPLAVRDIVIGRAANDRVVVTDAVTGAEIASYETEKGGFVRGSLRAFERMRQVAGVPVAAPYRIIRWESGRISLSDTATGERIYLEAFGKDNAAAFAALLGKQGGEKQ